MFTLHRQAELYKLASSPEHTIDRLHLEMKVGLSILAPFLLLLVGSFNSTSVVRDVCRLSLASLVLGLWAWRWLSPCPPKKTPRPIVFWMRRFKGSAAETYSAQRFVESTLCDCCVVILADDSVRVDSESRLMSGWRSHLLALASVWLLSWLQSWGGDAAVLGSGATALYSVNVLWMRFRSRPLCVTATSERFFREAVEAIRSRRVDRRSVLFACPADSPMWESLVDDLIPFADVAVVAHHDLAWANEVRAATAPNEPVPGLVKELAKTATALGAQKTVVLLREGENVSSGAEGMMTCVMPDKVGIFPLGGHAKQLAVALQSAVMAPRPGEANGATRHRFWAPGDDRRRPLWQLVGALLLAPAVFLIALTIAAFGHSLFPHLAPLVSQVATNPLLLVQPSQLGDDFWRGSWVVVAVFSSSSFVYWIWRRRPLSKEWLVNYSLGLGVCLLATGCNFDADTVPRDALGFVNIGAALAGFTAVATLRKVKPQSWRGALAHGLSLWGLVFGGVLVPLLFGLGLLLADTRFLAARLVHPLTYGAMAGALATVAWTTWTDVSRARHHRFTRSDS